MKIIPILGLVWLSLGGTQTISHAQIIIGDQNAEAALLPKTVDEDAAEDNLLPTNTVRDTKTTDDIYACILLLICSCFPDE